MSFYTQNVKLCEAAPGVHINKFAEDLIAYRKESKFDLIGKFNGVYFKVTINTTKEDIIKFINLI